MKKLVVIVIALFALQITSAQGMHKGKKGMDLSPEEMANLKTKKMTLALDLNKNQQSDIYKINLENATQRKSQKAERKSKHESGEIKKPTKKERLEMANKKLDHQIATKAKMKKILNSDQYTKWERMMAKRNGQKKDKSKHKKHHKRA